MDTSASSSSSSSASSSSSPSSFEVSEYRLDMLLNLLKNNPYNLSIISTTSANGCVLGIQFTQNTEIKGPSDDGTSLVPINNFVIKLVLALPDEAFEEGPDRRLDLWSNPKDDNPARFTITKPPPHNQKIKQHFSINGDTKNFQKESNIFKEIKLISTLYISSLQPNGRPVTLDVFIAFMLSEPEFTYIFFKYLIENSVNLGPLDPRSSNEKRIILGIVSDIKQAMKTTQCKLAVICLENGNYTGNTNSLKTLSDQLHNERDPVKQSEFIAKAIANLVIETIYLGNLGYVDIDKHRGNFLNSKIIDLGGFVELIMNPDGSFKLVNALYPNFTFSPLQNAQIISRIKNLQNIIQSEHLINPDGTINFSVLNEKFVFLLLHYISIIVNYIYTRSYDEHISNIYWILNFLYFTPTNRNDRKTITTMISGTTELVFDTYDLDYDIEFLHMIQDSNNFNNFSGKFSSVSQNSGLYRFLLYFFKSGTDRPHICEPNFNHFKRHLNDKLSEILKWIKYYSEPGQNPSTIFTKDEVRKAFDEGSYWNPNSISDIIDVSVVGSKYNVALMENSKIKKIISDLKTRQAQANAAAAQTQALGVGPFTGPPVNPNNIPPSGPAQQQQLQQQQQQQQQQSNLGLLAAAANRLLFNWR
jgi:hypothetical protein